MIKKLLGSVCILALGASGALAADPPAPYSDPWNWDGWYAGINAGAAFLDGDATVVTFFGAVTTLGLSASGFTGGAQLGRNWQNDQWLIGLEADINFADISENLTFPTKGTGTLRADYDWFATVRGRVGWITDDNETVFYGTAGIAFLGGDLTVTDTFGIAASATDSVVHVGFAAGAGIERMFSEKWSGKIEYLYMGFDEYEIPIAGMAGLVAAATIDPSLHVARIGLNYRF